MKFVNMFSRQAVPVELNELSVFDFTKVTIVHLFRRL